MLQEMQEDGVGRLAIRVQSVRVRAVHRAADDVAEKLLAQSLEEIVLRLEVRVEGRASDVGAVDDLLHRDLVVALLRCKIAESGKDCRPRLFLSSVHKSPLPYRFVGMFRKKRGASIIRCFPADVCLE